MKINAYAKINWDLHVLGKRADGFHELDTIMANVNLHDELEIERCKDLVLTCNDPSLPVDETNLVMKAARALAAASGYRDGARIHLTKNIPAGGGMGGGSSDAAATLAALNKIWELNWPLKKVQGIAAQLGSDVSFFLYGGWQRCRGRGEIIEPLAGSESWPTIPLLLVLPPWGVATPPVYKALGAKLLNEKTAARPLTQIANDIKFTLTSVHKSDFGAVPGLINDLTLAARHVEPRLLAVQEVLEANSPGRWLMSGSGSVHFVVAAAAKGMQLSEMLAQHAGPGFRVLSSTIFTPLI